MTNVTFRDYSAVGFIANSCDASAVHTLTGILFENAIGTYFHYESLGSAVEIINNSRVTFTNLVIRNHFGGNSALNAWLGGSITIKGCFSHERISPQIFGHAHIEENQGTIVDNSTGPCSGTIGNGDPAATNYPPPQPAACGLPSSGENAEYLSVSAVYNLTADCFQTGTLFKPLESTITINGNGFTIHAPPAGYAIRTAGDLTIRNAVLTGTDAAFLRGLLSQGTLLLEDVIIRHNYFGLLLADPIVALNRVVFDSNMTTSASASAVSAILIARQSRVTITDSVFRNNTGGTGAVYIGAKNSFHLAPSLTLLGCQTWEGNSPVNINDTLGGSVTDNRTGPCPASFVDNILTKRVTNRVTPPPSSSSRRRSSLLIAPGMCSGRDGIEAIPLGTTACIYRERIGEETELAIYGVNDQSVGYHLLTVYQSQLNAAVGESVIGVSADGRALVVMWADRNVTIKVGPDHENKIIHITFEGGLDGSIIGVNTTYGEAPGLPYLSDFGHAPASAPADTEERPLQGCQVTTTEYVNFRRAPGGETMMVLAPVSTSSASARTASWFRVSFGDAAGWINADYVSTQGACA